MTGSADIRARAIAGADALILDAETTGTDGAAIPTGANGIATIPPSTNAVEASASAGLDARTLP